MDERVRPEAALGELQLVLTSINHGYRFFGEKHGDDSPRAGACNIDVICPSADAWRNEIPAIGDYTLNGSWTCSGSMINNTAQDQTPYFLTANHCGVDSSNASTMVVYWNFHSPTCGAHGGGSLSTYPTGASLATQALTGACCNPTTGVCTIATQSACLGGGRVYQGNFTTCTPNPCAQPCLTLGDINVDGWVNGLDIAGFVRAKLGLAPLPGENPACADYGNGDLNLDIADFVADLLG